MTNGRGDRVPAKHHRQDTHQGTQNSLPSGSVIVTHQHGRCETLRRNVALVPVSGTDQVLSERVNPLDGWKAPEIVIFETISPSHSIAIAASCATVVGSPAVPACTSCVHSHAAGSRK